MKEGFFSLNGMELERWSMNPREQDVADLESVLLSERRFALDWHHLQVLIFVLRVSKNEQVRNVISSLVDHDDLAVSSMARDVIREWEVSNP